MAVYYLFLLLLFLCSSSLFCISNKLTVTCLSMEIQTEAISLLTFKSSVSFDPSNLILSTWNPAKSSHCLWYGVTCDRVSGKLITGKLPPAVGNLTELRVLSLPYNAFYGEIPMEVGRLRHLEILELQGNNFSGNIPVQISSLLNLRLLNLSYNLLSGPIPEKLIGFSRSAIDLSYNQLSDGIRIDHFSRCESLVHLKLSGNFLVNKIPPEIGNCSNLRSLLLDGNILEGQIPAEIGRISELRVLDVSRNSLTDRIPKELANCWKLSVLVLTNLQLVDFESAAGGDNYSADTSSTSTSRGEFNAFLGGIPAGILLLPNLEIFWAPRANLGGRLMMMNNRSWRRDTCKLRILNLGQNYLTGLIPQKLGMCQNLSYLDLSSNVFHGVLPSQLQVPCMVYFNISRNSLSGSLPRFSNTSCPTNSLIKSSQDQDNDFFVKENSIENNPNYYYFTATLWASHHLMMSKAFRSMLYEDFLVIHDFSWNSFSSLLPLFSFGDGFLPTDRKPSYQILLNNNKLNGSLPGILFSACPDLKSFAVDLSFNQLSGGIQQGLLFNCLQLTSFVAANNQISGSIPPDIGDSRMLQYFDMSENRMNGLLPIPLGKLKDLKCILLGGNHFTGEIPAQLGHLSSLAVLDISRNALSGIIPSSFADAHNLEELLLHHNNLSGEIPPSFSTLASLTKLDVSFNNLSGHIPRLKHMTDCDGFKGNILLQPCPDPYSASPAGLPVPFEVHKRHSRKGKLKWFVIVMVVAASVIVLVLITVILVLVFGRRKLARVSSLKRQVVVTFTNVPTKLNYEIVVRATGNFSVRNLIGTGGFGATYKAELAPGFLVAVKRLSIGRFHGIQQFDAEIRTLGRIRHKNLVTLIGYYMGESEMFLIYNYLSGGNLETFIHDRSGENVKWQVIHKIALDIAQAITYLHYYCAPRIVHRDIKPSNILLDEDLNAYLSDFGLARLLEVSETHATTDVAGTFGYVAPEYATTCRVSDKSDVYSFGVVLLELMSGKKSLDPSFSEYGNGFNIVAWGKLLIMEGRSSELFSPELWDAGPKENLLVMLRLASDCTVESLSVRPSMKQVLDKLKQLNAPEI